MGKRASEAWLWIVAVAAVVVPHLKVESLSVPAERKSTKPGWLVVMILRIHAWYLDTLANTVGESAKAHPLPKLTTPDSTHCGPCLLTIGPPESPFRGRGSSHDGLAKDLKLHEGTFHYLVLSVWCCALCVWCLKNVMEGYVLSCTSAVLH